MPKMKTHRGAAKRFSLTGTGRVKRCKSLQEADILNKKSSKRKRNLRKGTYICAGGAEKHKSVDSLQVIA